MTQRESAIAWWNRLKKEHQNKILSNYNGTCSSLKDVRIVESLTGREIEILWLQSSSFLGDLVSEVTKPEDVESDIKSRLKVALKFFENELKREIEINKVYNLKPSSHYHLVVSGEYSREVCDAVENVYRLAGWDAECRTLSENGERPGLTGLILKTK